MKPFIQAIIPDSEIVLVAKDLTKKWREGDPEVRSLFPTIRESTAERQILKSVREEHEKVNEAIFINDVYQVAVRRFGNRMFHLSIKRIDRQAIHNWRELQEIKNELIGEECEGVELYPAESRKVDTATQYHLWCCLDPDFRFPFGFTGGRVVSDKAIGKSFNLPTNETDKIRNKQG